MTGGCRGIITERGARGRGSAECRVVYEDNTGGDEVVERACAKQAAWAALPKRGVEQAVCATDARREGGLKGGCGSDPCIEKMRRLLSVWSAVRGGGL